MEGAAHAHWARDIMGSHGREREGGLRGGPVIRALSPSWTQSVWYVCTSIGHGYVCTEYVASGSGRNYVHPRMKYSCLQRSIKQGRAPKSSRWHYGHSCCLGRPHSICPGEGCPPPSFSARDFRRSGASVVGRRRQGLFRTVSSALPTTLHLVMSAECGGREPIARLCCVCPVLPHRS